LVLCRLGRWHTVGSSTSRADYLSCVCSVVSREYCTVYVFGETHYVYEYGYLYYVLYSVLQSLMTIKRHPNTYNFTFPWGRPDVSNHVHPFRMVIGNCRDNFRSNFQLPYETGSRDGIHKGALPVMRPRYGKACHGNNHRCFSPSGLTDA